MKLPFAEKAHIDEQKLAGYCLSETHALGKHKARVFKAALGLTAADSHALKEAILTAVLLNEAQVAGGNQQGDMYTLEFSMTFYKQKAMVRTAWIIRFDESFPRLVSCYVNE